MDSQVNELEKKVLLRLQAQCSRREYCSSEMSAKALQALNGDEAAAARVMEALLRDKFVDDVRYAAAFAREKASLQGWGPVKIRYMLAAKGIARADIDAALPEVDPEAADRRMEGLLQAKWRTLSDDPQGKLKLIRFALGRGYDYERVRDVVERIVRQGE